MTRAWLLIFRRVYVYRWRGLTICGTAAELAAYAVTPLAGAVGLAVLL